MTVTEDVVRCAECGFDAARWSRNDLARTLAHHDDLIDHVLAGVASPLPPVMHRAAHATADGRGAAGGVAEADRTMITQVHDLMHHLDGLAGWRRDAEPFVPLDGVVASVQTSGGGVPKRPVAEVAVDLGGLVGDGQAHRRHHGRPWQAVSLYSGDVIDALAAEGHPISPGAAGENLTLRGIDWARLRGGLTIAIGDVRLLTSSPADPCTTIARCFVGRDWHRIDHARRPGWSRWYASVRAAGTIRPGDPVRITA